MLRSSPNFLFGKAFKQFKRHFFQRVYAGILETVLNGCPDLFVFQRLDELVAGGGKAQGEDRPRQEPVYTLYKAKTWVAIVPLPCIDRNLSASIVAVTVAQAMVTLGTTFVSDIPFDKAVTAMQQISENMSDENKETSTRGLALVMKSEVEAERPDLFTAFLDDGRICLTNNAAERAFAASPLVANPDYLPGLIAAVSGPLSSTA